MKPGDKVYVTKYALTKGVFRCELIEREGLFASVRWPGGLGGKLSLYGLNAVVATEKQAQAVVRSIIERKRKSLQKQLAQLDKLEQSGVKIVDK